ncbi:hypothetical protein DVA67_027265 [Solirubrobacter sp. CPCC 204708]|uniref:FIST domain-containing protein n=1 Tax=Solirubrobacter deserti TaxID=2282478 RepID=A0ABT4RG89_9ACTN|nr:FIST N-terminal domain-containing protein [Solirubrobacter deserti]MBE2319699.1 hypothetical protein [Solirubrobacter deserti]MDA0137561.1 hypothetical protein [Solirubrobacter deserti]
MTAQRWVGVGRSADTDSATAGAAARATALDGRDDTRLLVVFASPAHDLDARLAGVGDDVPVVGCSTAGEIATDGPGDRGVVVLALGGAGFSVCTAVATGASARLRELGCGLGQGYLFARPAETLLTAV